ncbi:hypothetical protein RhoBH5_32150, partial [Rhodococcus sp. BH5]|nr:hypothetical protein [Rhodococcus sp. BH5]
MWPPRWGFRKCTSKWGNPYPKYGDLGITGPIQRTAPPPGPTAAGVVAEIEFMRRTRKWSASRITFELRMDGT